MAIDGAEWRKHEVGCSKLRQLMALNEAYRRWGAATKAIDGLNGAYTGWGAAT